MEEMPVFFNYKDTDQEKMDPDLSKCGR